MHQITPFRVEEYADIVREVLAMAMTDGHRLSVLPGMLHPARTTSLQLPYGSEADFAGIAALLLDPCGDSLPAPGISFCVIRRIGSDVCLKIGKCAEPLRRNRNVRHVDLLLHRGKNVLWIWGSPNSILDVLAD